MLIQRPLSSSWLLVSQNENFLLCSLGLEDLLISNSVTQLIRRSSLRFFSPDKLESITRHDPRHVIPPMLFQFPGQTWVPLSRLTLQGETWLTSFSKTEQPCHWAELNEKDHRSRDFGDYVCRVRAFESWRKGRTGGEGVWFDYSIIFSPLGSFQACSTNVREPMTH